MNNNHDQLGEFGFRILRHGFGAIQLPHFMYRRAQAGQTLLAGFAMEKCHQPGAAAHHGIDGHGVQGGTGVSPAI